MNRKSKLKKKRVYRKKASGSTLLIALHTQVKYSAQGPRRLTLRPHWPKLCSVTIHNCSGGQESKDLTFPALTVESRLAEGAGCVRDKAQCPVSKQQGCYKSDG